MARGLELIPALSPRQVGFLLNYLAQTEAALYDLGYSIYPWQKSLVAGGGIALPYFKL